MNRRFGALALAIAIVGGFLVGWYWTARGTAGVEPVASAQPVEQSIAQPHVVASTPEQAGRYLILSAGCNDCHTPGWMQMGDKIPESLWLTGVPVGWRGPWGTTYASNLRLAVKPFTADQFVEMTRKRNARPPMPWSSLHAMSDQDLRSIYAYIKSQPEVGVRMPDDVPPDRAPKGPYLSMEPQGLSAATQPTARK
jgi:mono/diheme cytochrome c family protein